MPVIDELYIRNGTNRVPVDSINNKVIEEIVINDQIYHFAKESAATGVDSVVCENAVNEPFRSIEVSGDTTQPILPNEYQQIEYLQSTGTQYIDTGVIPNNETGFSIEMSISEIVTDRFLFGCRQDSGNSRFLLGVNNTLYFGFGGNYSAWTVNRDKTFTAKLNFLNSRIASVNDTSEKALSNLSANITYSIIMFGRNSAGSISSSAQTIKACKISQGDAIIRDFIPCYRKVDGVAGMYDLVEGVFYTNQGTGTFIKGANYTTPPTPDNPIDIVNAGDNGLEVEVRGNLFDESLLLTYDKQANNKVLKSDNGYEIRGYPIAYYSDFITHLKSVVKPNTDYTIAYTLVERGASYAGWFILNASSTQIVNIGRWSKGVAIGTFNLTQEQLDSITSVYFYGTNDNQLANGTPPTIVSNFQLVEGIYTADTLPPYGPYFEPTTLSIPATVGDLELRFAKYDDTNKDSLIVDGVNKKVIYKQMLDKIIVPAEKWRSKYYTNNKYTGISAPNVLPFFSSNRQKGLCSHAKKTLVDNISVTEMSSIWLGVSNNYVYWIGIISLLGYDSDWVDKASPTTEEWEIARDKFQVWLAEHEANGHPFECVYVMPTPIEHDITDTELGDQLLALAANKGTNILEITGATSLDVSYWRQVLPDEEI